MPILDKWIESPLDFIEECIGSSVRNITNVKDYFRKRIIDLKDVNCIPSINDVQLDLIKPNSLVRCRCMVQDQFDPEYYLGQYETYNSNTHEKKVKLGVFQDINSLQAGEEVIHESEDNVTLERQTLYCVPVPGENEWVKQKYASRNVAKNQAEERKLSQAKRGREEDISIDAEEQMDINVENQHGVDLPKRYCNGNQSHTATAATVNGGSLSQNEVFDPNFPLPEKNRCPFFIIMYDNEERPKLNEVYEFIGIMSCDSELATATMGGRNDCNDELAFADTMTAEERLVHCPPASLVPRIHCILSEKLAHSNPLLTSSVNCEGAFRALENEIESIRETIIQSMARVIFGDTLAAEYVLLNAISRVYGRVEPMVLGKFSVNVTKCPAAVNGRSLSVPQEVGTFFELITTKSHSIQLTISNLNQMKFIPKKDYNVNRLTSGLLQLSEGTHLICDETALQPGQLTPDGVKNLTAIGNVIQWQKVDYDFQFHHCEMKTDITMLIFSEAKSLLQCDCIVPIIQQSSASQSASSLVITMDSDMLEKIRVYLELCRLMDFNLTDEMQEIIKNDYVEMRENDRSAMNPEAFHLLLVMARLVAISYGKKELTKELWQKTKDLEIQRGRRL